MEVKCQCGILRLFCLFLPLFLLFCLLSGCQAESSIPASGNSQAVSSNGSGSADSEIGGNHGEISWEDPYKDAAPISSAGSGYGSILRIKSDRSLLFSPYVSELITELDAGMPFEDYTFTLTITLLDEDGEEYYTYPTIEDPPAVRSSAGNFFDIYFKGSHGDMGFCPTAGYSYNIFLGVLDPEGNALCCGYYNNLYTPDEFASNRYYDPTPLPDEPDREAHAIVYGVYGAGGHLEGSTAQTLSFGEEGAAVCAVPEEGYRFLRWSDGVGTAERMGDRITSNRAVYAQFVSNVTEDHGVPIISIDVENGENITDRYTWKGCTVTVKGTDADYAEEKLSAAIRGRGNGSWEQSPLKKPYKIKFDKKINLLGIGAGEAKDWVLLPQAKEFTFLRTFMAFRMGQLLEGIDYASGFALVEVYLNGEYMGVYQLAEQVEVQESRIQVTEQSDTNEIGFLVELDRYASGYGSFKVRAERYMVKSEMQTNGQLRYIEQYIKAVDTALYGGNREEIEALIDLDSFIDMFLLQEYLKNTDAGWSSFYMYREIGGKLTFGAPWDFDLSQGNDPRFRDGAWDGFDGGEGYSAGYDQDNEWFVAMWKHLWFRQALYERWLEITDSVIPQMWEEGKAIAEAARTAIDANFEKWQTLPGSYDDAVEELMDWLQNRKQWMDENFPLYLNGTPDL